MHHACSLHKQYQERRTAAQHRAGAEPGRGGTTVPGTAHSDAAARTEQSRTWTAQTGGARDKSTADSVATDREWGECEQPCAFERAASLLPPQGVERQGTDTHVCEPDLCEGTDGHTLYARHTGALYEYWYYGTKLA